MTTRGLPVVLIGPMASGKSRVGRRIARELGVPFIDTDAVVVAEHGPISEIFVREGEDFFRVLERAAVAEALEQPAVVSLGGGAVLDENTQHDLREATVIRLTISPKAVARRLRGSKRPLLAGDAVAAWMRINTEREPLYRRLAQTSFDTSTGPISRVAAEIVAWLEERA